MDALRDVALARLSDAAGAKGRAAVAAVGTDLARPVLQVAAAGISLDLEGNAAGLVDCRPSCPSRQTPKTRREVWLLGNVTLPIKHHPTTLRGQRSSAVFPISASECLQVLCRFLPAPFEIRETTFLVTVLCKTNAFSSDEQYVNYSSTQIRYFESRGAAF